MTRNLKALGLALVAVFAMSAIAAQAAFAAEEFHAEKAPSIGTSEQDPTEPLQHTKITNSTGGVIVEVTCKKFHSEGTQATLTATTTTVHPEYSECTSSLGSAEVRTHMCHYEISSKTDAEGHAHSNIFCEKNAKGEEEPIEIESAGCIIKTGTQTGTEGGVHFTNLGSGSTRSVTVKSTVKHISFTANFACQLAGVPASGTSSDYEGSTVTKAYEDLGGETTAYKEGAQIGAWWE